MKLEKYLDGKYMSKKHDQKDYYEGYSIFKIKNKKSRLYKENITRHGSPIILGEVDT
jgi:hypothetical protein